MHVLQHGQNIHHQEHQKNRGYNVHLIIQTLVYGYDWEKQYMDADSLTEIMLNTEYLTDGANLLMHDRSWTAGALPSIVEGFRAKGYDLIDPHSIKGIE